MASSPDKVPPEIREALDRLLDTGHTWVDTITGTKGSVTASITDAQDTVATVTFPLPAAADPLDTFASGLAAWMSSSGRPLSELLERGQEVECDTPAAVFHGVERSGMLQLVHHLWALSVHSVSDKSSGEWPLTEELEGLLALRREHEVYFARYLLTEPPEPQEESPASVFRRLRPTEEDPEDPSQPQDGSSASPSQGLRSLEEDLRLLRVKNLMNCLWVPEHSSRSHWEPTDSAMLVSLLTKIDNLKGGRPVALTIFIHSPQRAVDETLAALLNEDLKAAYAKATWAMTSTTELGGVSSWTFSTSNLDIKIRSLHHLSVFHLLSLHYVAWLGESRDGLEQVIQWQKDMNTQLSVFNAETGTWETSQRLPQ